MFEKVSADAEFVGGEHQVLKFWESARIFDKLRAKNAGKPPWSFLDGPITANNPMGVHHAWGRTYKDAYQRFFAMNGHELRYQNGFDCQGLWVEIEVERDLGFTTKASIETMGIDTFSNACKQRVLKFAARQTEQSIRLGYWMDWDNPEELRKLSENVGQDEPVTITTPSGKTATGPAHQLVGRLGCPEWGGSYFTFSTENNETIWTFLKKCFERGKIKKGHDVMPWSGRAGSAYSQMEVADGRKLSVHKSVFVRFPLRDRTDEYLLVWTTTPWTLTSNVAAAVNPELEYVKLKSKRDGAVYYFAKENLDFQRLSREFKEGFGRPEWEWPKDVPKLKSLGQIFKEQGGFEIEATILGAQMVGWEYDGPFDDLAAQQQSGGVPTEDSMADKSGVSCHRVIDGGRDSKGKPNVVAGEGTGIVHIAPGCGDIDHKLGAEHGIVGIAPLEEDGTFTSEFGDFASRRANDPETAALVFEKLKAKHLLVAVESYPHIYPHCWRTGDELVFRLVDEWFIDMDWRDEIKAVTEQIRWLPDSIDGKEREIEWLTNMRDWMISKKRFWGLALPIWVDEETGDFEVIGSLAELKERAVEGWDEFEGHTPHRPWIDKVKIANPKNGNVMSRIPDVGNPWLDAGIVPFSTMHYNSNREEWQKWYPADFVTECFPGQFRNWFYALLAMGTMMDNSPPFKNLLGHRLVMNEEGKQMHKGDGTAIWFEEAAEQIGVDTLRWMYMSQNPATDLRFGHRNPEQPVTLQTADGPIDQTAEGHPTCKVVSPPADETRRQILITLWNTYTFFVNYARLDEFDVTTEAMPVAERPEIDRWVLANLHALIQTANEEMQDFNVAGFLREAARFIDDLSNWYIRRNRRRFWRSKDAGDRDKLAAYQTLYDVLVTLTKLLAPVIPFLSERLYQNLVCAVDKKAPESVHLCDYPQADPAVLDPELSERMALAQLVVNLGHGLREKTSLRVRQPLAELRFACANPAHLSAIENLLDVIKEELNIKQITGCENLDELVSYTYKPNLKTLGPRYGKLLGVIRKELPNLDGQLLAPLRSGESVTVTLGGEELGLGPDDVMVGTEQAADWAAADQDGVQIALATVLTPELIGEGMARDVVRHVQQLRKDADLEIENRIVVTYCTDDAEVVAAIEQWQDYICGETLADALNRDETPPEGAKSVSVGPADVALAIAKV
ncbi:Isoleucine--tRNA ligase [Symmachiella macrocystis]|uniref:Isoleucine--tRNA ligase n=1 Tax=Symmachiella macrocystis TaxID=2527985 RepID=A0A5C6BRB7_9PLAN|nr:class I tRNA ligase family protein [Symmachiella macrocystis]TWU14297.1 Isoleucine--tRNA ligase [Symmachiella macrocystis]